MTDCERAGLKALHMEKKAALHAQEGLEKQASLERKRYTDMNKPSVSEALKMGDSAFMRKIRKRILMEHSDQIELNRCPKCDRIPRTPKAKQCPWCRHSWRDEVS
jgi:ssDNA-binding Zn-finger/Zn-ribbon topoisomerase 1